MKIRLYHLDIKMQRVLIVLFLISSLIGCREKAPAEKESVKDTDVVTESFISIFNGTSLEGWEGDLTYWRAENGVLIGEISPETLLKTNTFIIWQGGQPGDFELKLEFRISESGNSGINYRSEQLDSIPFALRGYQADIDGKHRYTGQNYEERKRTTLAYRGERAVISSQTDPDQPGSLRANVKSNAWQSREVIASLGDIDSLKTNINTAWNSCHLVVKGNNLKHYINGVLMSEVIDNDSINRKASGALGFQVHVGPPMKVEYRNIRLKQL